MLGNPWTNNGNGASSVMEIRSTRIVETFQEDRGEFVLLGFIGLATLLAYLDTRELLPGTKRVPEFIIALIGVVIVFTVVMKLYGDDIRSVLGWSEAETGFGIGADIDEGEQEDEHLYDIQPKSVAKHFVWIFLYLLSLAYIGFWTTNIVFPFVYIMTYETSPLPRRFVYFLIWTGVIVAALWILFVELLQVQAIWRLGFLP